MKQSGFSDNDADGLYWGCVIAMELHHLFSFYRSQKETLSDIQLHLTALRGDEMLLRKVLDSGKVHVDCKDEVIAVVHLLFRFHCSK